MRASIFNTESFPTAPRTEEGRVIVAAGNATIHAAVQESAANNSFTAITQPDVPRLLSATFQAGWQGGDIFIVGLDANLRYQTETIIANPGATVAGTKVFSYIMSIVKTIVAGTTDTVTIGTSGVANYYSAPMDIVGSAGLSVEIETTGTLTGTWTLWRANRHNPDYGNDTHWVQETTFVPTNPAGAATHWSFEMNGAQGRRWRLKYVPAGVGGSLFAWATSEMQ